MKKYEKMFAEKKAETENLSKLLAEEKVERQQQLEKNRTQLQKYQNEIRFIDQKLKNQELLSEDLKA
jgi:hypothetical protein